MSNQPRKMDKITYSRWIEEQKKKFKVGEQVTLAMVAPVKDRLPWLLRISYIEEDHNHVYWDVSADDPACITLTTPTGVTNHKAPSTLRHLTPEEIELVKLSNTQSLGTA